MTPTTMVATPEGRNIEIWNPLYSYEFKPLPSAGAFDGKVRDVHLLGSFNADTKISGSK